MIHDLGRVTGGFLRLHATGPGTVRVATSETRRFLEPDGDVTDATNPQPTVRSYDVQGAGELIEPMHRGGLRYVLVDGPVDRVRVDATHWTRHPRRRFGAPTTSSTTSGRRPSTHWP